MGAQDKHFAEKFLGKSLEVHLLEDEHEREWAEADTVICCPIILFGHLPLRTEAL